MSQTLGASVRWIWCSAPLKAATLSPSQAALLAAIDGEDTDGR